MNKIIYLPAALLITIYPPLSLSDSSTHSGEGTFYGYGGGGNCSFPKPGNMLTAAMNATDYAGSAACGGVIVVTNEDTGLSVTVRIDDQCPECAKGDVDLDQSAFAQIAEISKGRIPISWRYVTNDQAGNMKLYFKEGSTRWWTAVQVRDHLYPIAKLGYRVTGSGSDYIDLPRQPYNYFLANSGFGDGPYDFRITDFWGQTVEVSGISLVVTSEIDTGMQFPVYGDNNIPVYEPVEEPVYEPDISPVNNPVDPTNYPADTSMSTITSWDSGYCANVKVTNPNSSQITWSVNLDVGGSVTNLWNAQWSQSGTILTASGFAWDANLDAGESTVFGFCANY
jgi:expansin (peptidoglycan-binding protein)